MRRKSVRLALLASGFLGMSVTALSEVGTRWYPPLKENPDRIAPPQTDSQTEAKPEDTDDKSNSTDAATTATVSVPAAVVEFSPGDAELTEEAKTRLQSFFEVAKKEGDIESIKVAAWADVDPPVDFGKDLSPDDRRLAAMRALAVKAYLRDQLDLTRIQLFNMASSATWLSRVFNTEDAELKSVFARRKLDDGRDQPVSPEVQKVHDVGHPSSAVIVIRYRQNYDIPPDATGWMWPGGWREMR